MIGNIPALEVMQETATNVQVLQVLSDTAVAALAVGLAALATAYAQRGIGSAAMGAIAEDSDNFAPGIILTALPETIIIIAFVVVFVV